MKTQIFSTDEEARRAVLLKYLHALVEKWIVSVNIIIISTKEIGKLIKKREVCKVCDLGNHLLSVTLL